MRPASAVGSLPDVAMLARMANEFFRAQPGQGFPSDRCALACPMLQELTPAFETRLPQFGMPLPSVPAMPSAGKFPWRRMRHGLSTGVHRSCRRYMIGARCSRVSSGSRAAPAAGMLQHDPRSAAAGSSLSLFLADARVWRAVSVL